MVTTVFFYVSKCFAAKLLQILSFKIVLYYIRGFSAKNLCVIFSILGFYLFCSYL